MSLLPSCPWSHAPLSINLPSWDTPRRTADDILSTPEEAIAPTNIKLQSDLTYEEKPIHVLEELERVTRSRVIKFYKVEWNNHSEQDATWEREDYLCEVYPAFYEEW